MKEIPLRDRAGGVVGLALVDDEDFARLSGYRWHFDRDRYAVRAKKRAGGFVIVSLQRDVLGLVTGDGLIADHINRDRLDCRRCNLRVLTIEQSAQNRGPGTRSRSRFRGVHFVPATGRWIARVRLGNPGRLHNLGTYGTAEEAARVASAFRKEHMPYSVEEAVA